MLFQQVWRRQVCTRSTHRLCGVGRNRKNGLWLHCNHERSIIVVLSDGIEKCIESSCHNQAVRLSQSLSSTCGLGVSTSRVFVARAHRFATYSTSLHSLRDLFRLASLAPKRARLGASPQLHNILYYYLLIHIHLVCVLCLKKNKSPVISLFPVRPVVECFPPISRAKKAEGKNYTTAATTSASWLS